MGGAGESMFGPNACEITAGVSLLILCSIRAQHGCHVGDYRIRRLEIEIGQPRGINWLLKSPCYEGLLRGRQNINIPALKSS